LQRTFAAGEALGRRRQRLDLGAHRVAGDHRGLGPRRGSTVEAERHLVGHRQQRAVAHQQGRVGVHQHQRPTEHRRHQPAGEADITAHAEHGVGRARAEDADAVPERLQHAHAAGQRLHRPLAAQPAEADAVEHDAGARHEAVLHTLPSAEPAHRPAARLHLPGHREAGNDVPAGARGHDHEVRHYARPPRISCRFWLRHARCARFTSPSDVSLRRNRPPALRAGATLALRANVALMRGLRA
jgi:hypothetical protein